LVRVWINPPATLSGRVPAVLIGTAESRKIFGQEPAMNKDACRSRQLLA
jgi:hypothetical protein